MSQPPEPPEQVEPQGEPEGIWGDMDPEMARAWAAAASGTEVIGITAAGQAVLTAQTNRDRLHLMNTGTVPVWVYYNADGSNNGLVTILRGGTAAGDGTGGEWRDDTWKGPVWVKAPATGGRVIAAEHIYP